MRRFIIFIVLFIAYIAVTNNISAQIYGGGGGGGGGTMTRQQVIDTISEVKGVGSDIPAGQEQPITISALNSGIFRLYRTGNSGDEGTVHITLRSHLVGLKVDSDLYLAEDVPGNPTTGNAYIKWTSDGRMQVTYTGGMTGVARIKTWKNATEDRATLYDTYYHGDDFFLDNNADGGGNDSVYFDMSGELSFLGKALGSAWAPIPMTVGDSLVPWTIWNDGTYGDLITTVGKQGEALWLINNHEAAAATNNSAAITLLNQNMYGMPGIHLSGSSSGWNTGNVFEWRGMNIDGPRVQGDTLAPGIEMIGLDINDSDIRFGASTTTVQDSMFSWMHTEFRGNLLIPNGTDFPSSPKTGQIFFKTTNDTLGVFNGTAWKVIALTDR